MTVHIEGMGWLGSMLARRLERADIDFTWSDNDDPFPAWPASTGLVYPTAPDDERSVRGMNGWKRWLKEDEWLAGYTEPVSVGFVTANPPSGGKYPSVDVGGLKIGEAPCFATDPPSNRPRLPRAVRRRPSQRPRHRATRQGSRARPPPPVDDVGLEREGPAG